MPEGEFNPNSYDAVLATINAKLDTVNSTLTKMQNTESANHKLLDTKIDTYNTNLTTKITEVNNKVVALEYFRYYLAGMTTTASAIGGAVFSYIFTKFFGGGGPPSTPHA